MALAGFWSLGLSNRNHISALSANDIKNASSARSDCSPTIEKKAAIKRNAALAKSS
jgi:hypothetical protein